MDKARAKTPARRKKLINPRVQLELISYFILFFGLTLGFIYFEVKRYIQVATLEHIRIEPGNPLSTQLFSDQLMKEIDKLFISHGLILLILVFAGGVLVSHRIVGPIYRLKVLLTQLRDGITPTNVKFRKHDYFQDLSDLVEQIIQNKR